MPVASAPHTCRQCALLASSASGAFPTRTFLHAKTQLGGVLLTARARARAHFFLVSLHQFRRSNRTGARRSAGIMQYYAKACTRVRVIKWRIKHTHPVRCAAGRSTLAGWRWFYCARARARSRWTTGAGEEPPSVPAIQRAFD